LGNAVEKNRVQATVPYKGVHCYSLGTRQKLHLFFYLLRKVCTVLSATHHAYGTQYYTSDHSSDLCEDCPHRMELTKTERALKPLKPEDTCISGI
jgi:hypothetical protein